jgi:hypothetical protein
MTAPADVNTIARFSLLPFDVGPPMPGIGHGTGSAEPSPKLVVVPAIWYRLHVYRDSATGRNPPPRYNGKKQ